MTDGSKKLYWRHAGLPAGVHSRAVVGERAIEISAKIERVKGRRHDGWFRLWYFRIDGGAWRGDPSGAAQLKAIGTRAAPLGFSTMREARAAALREVSA